MGKSTRQPNPRLGMVAAAPHEAMIGARKDAMALMNCPKVSVEARWSLTYIETSGFSEVCMSVLPMPSNENETSITTKFSEKIGNNSETTVTMSESITVFLRPILFISTPVGTEKIRNQKKTSDGKKLATVSLRFRSCLT